MAKQRSYAEVDALLCQPGTPFEIEVLTIRGQEQKTWKHAPLTFRHFFSDRMQHWAAEGRVMISAPRAESMSEDEREYLTYGEVWERSEKLAAWLRDRGVRAGTRVAIGGRNCASWMVSFIAICLLGAIPVLLNSTLVPEAQLHCLKLTKPALVLCDPEDASVLGALPSELRAGGVGPVFCWSPLKHVAAGSRAGVSEVTLDTNLSVSAKSLDEVKTGKGFGFESVGPESDALVLFTSGTTSMPKGVICTQRACLSHVIGSSIPAARAILRAGGSVADALAVHVPPPEQAAMLLAVPLFHVTGLLGWMSRAVQMGLKMVFMKRWNVAAAVKLCVSEKIGAIGGVPSIATAILQSPDLPDDHEMMGLTYGGAPSPARLAADIAKRWPNAVATHAYGMTETSGLHTGFAGPDYLAHPEAVGPAMPVAAMRIVDPESRRVLEDGQAGIVECYGPNIMKEYVDNPKATAEALRDGWVHTGDLGYLDKETGYLVISDRAKDIVIRGGENIASAEVENAVYKDDRIAEAACVPVPCPLMGERVGVCVSLAPGASATADSVKAEAHKRLRHPARPAIVLIVDALPRNANGKIVKSDVKKIVGDAWKVQQEAEREPRAKL